MSVPLGKLSGGRQRLTTYSACQIFRRKRGLSIGTRRLKIQKAKTICLSKDFNKIKNTAFLAVFFIVFLLIAYIVYSLKLALIDLVNRHVLYYYIYYFII